MLGRQIYEQCEDVVILKEQVRVVDPMWLDVLRAIRWEEIKEAHMDESRKLTLTDPKCKVSDFQNPP